MRKRLLAVGLAGLITLAMTACAGSGSAPAFSGSKPSVEKKADKGTDETGKKTEDKSGSENTGDAAGEADFRIGIVTGSYAQSEDDRRGAQAFRDKYGDDMVTLAIYPDNFIDEEETTIATMVDLADDPRMKAIIVNQAVDGTTEAFRRIKEKRPDILCIAGEAYEDFADIEKTADLVVNCDFVGRGYLIIKTAHELGCDTFVHISFPRHMSYETVARRVAIMEAACEEFGMEFVMEEAPDPTTDAGVVGAQAYITEQVPGWVEKYGENSAYFCTNDAHTEPLIRQLLEHGGYFIEADLPSPLMGYPGALDLDLTAETGDFEKVLKKVEDAVVKKGGAGRFGTWASSYGYTMSAGLAEHVRNVILGKSELDDIGALTEAYAEYSRGTDWNGSAYIDAATGEKSGTTILIYQDTYIFGDPGHYMGSTKVEVPQKYFTIK